MGARVRGSPLAQLGGQASVSQRVSKDLNEAQLDAVRATEDPVVLIAGPGTGKTLALVRRSLHILTSGLAEPHEIVLCTFTEKAALELRDRLRAAAIDAATPATSVRSPPERSTECAISSSTATGTSLRSATPCALNNVHVIYARPLTHPPRRTALHPHSYMYLKKSLHAPEKVLSVGHADCPTVATAQHVAFAVPRRCTSCRRGGTFRSK